MNAKTASATPHFRSDLFRWQNLVTPGWLFCLQQGAPVDAMPAKNWCLFEVDFGAPGLFSLSHIPGAGYIDTNRLEQAPLWNKVSDHALLQLLLDLGVRHDTTVVLYGRNTTAAARAIHLMLYAGVTDVRMLDGGFSAWESAGLLVASGAPHRHAGITDFGAAFPGRPEYLINIEQVKSLLQQTDGTLVSIRTWDEFIGNTSGYSYINAKGEIPGARWGHAGEDEDVNSMSAFHHANGTMKAAAEICQFWAKAGISQDRQTAFYCGTGWRASMAFFYAWLMNWERISVYDGGWLEWSSDPENPTVSGIRSDEDIGYE